MGQNQGIPEKKKTPDLSQADPGLSHVWPKLGFNPQQWADQWFWVLKISILNQQSD